MTLDELRFAWITNNAYDTLAIVSGDKVVSKWGMTPKVAREYLDAGDINEWDLNYPEEQEISDYGDEVTGTERQERIDFFIR
jgi:hypothetical protein